MIDFSIVFPRILDNPEHGSLPFRKPLCGRPTISSIGSRIIGKL